MASRGTDVARQNLYTVKAVRRFLAEAIPFTLSNKEPTMSRLSSAEILPTPSRRGFLQQSGALLGSALAAGLPIARSAHAAGSDILRVGLIGCGGRGAGAAVNALNADPNSRLVALGDVFPDMLNSTARTSAPPSPGRRRSTTTIASSASTPINR